MTFVTAAALFVVLVAMSMMMARLFLGPTLYDRILAVNSFGTKTVMFLVLFAFFIDRGDAIDIAILYALINFVATIAILKFFRYRAFDLALERMSDGSTPPSFFDDKAHDPRGALPPPDGGEGVRPPRPRTPARRVEEVAEEIEAEEDFDEEDDGEKGR